MENPICKVNNISNSNVLYFVLLCLGDHSNVTVRLEPNPKKKNRRKEFADPYKMITHFSWKIVGSLREAPPPAFACKTMPSLGSGTVVFEFWELELVFQTRSWFTHMCVKP